MGYRFIHTADWQLGRRYGRFDPHLSGRISAERQSVISRIANAAISQGADHIIVAGDVWDSPTPEQADIRQPLDIMKDYNGLTWWIMPGNHDPDGPQGLWDRISDMAPSNVRLLRRAVPTEMIAADEKGGGLWLLPAPWERIQHGRDLTDYMDNAETPENAIRVGIAHGSIKNFNRDVAENGGETDPIIPPDRADRAALDYLALGDWHARTIVNPRTHYPGTPEPDRFKSGARGQVILVEIDAPGRLPVTTDINTGTYDWTRIDLKLQVGEAEAALDELEKIVNTGRPARFTLADIHLSGDSTVQEWAMVETQLEQLRERCAYVDVTGENRVTLKIVAEDIETLDAQGSVRQAAEALKARSENAALSQADRDMAHHALRLLFAFAATDDACA